MLDSNDTSHININNTSKLQPMGVGDILDTTFSLYRKHFLLFFGIASIYFFAILIEYSLKGFISGAIQKALLPTLTVMPFAIVSTGGVVLASAKVYLGENITSSAALRQVFKRFFPVLGSHLIWRLFFVFTFLSIGFSINFFFYIIMTCVDLILTTLVFPIWTIGLTLLYFDRRSRKESSDVELTADNT